MDAGLIGIIGGLGGVVASIAGIIAVLWALGFFDYMGGERPLPIQPLPRQELTDRILALNDDSKPFRIAPGAKSDLLAEWKIADAKWYGLFNKNALKEAYRALILLDEKRHTARYYEELGTISWSVGVEGLKPTIAYARSFLHGRILFQKKFAVAYGMEEAGAANWEKVYSYRFDVNEIRGPIGATVMGSGWEWVPVTARRNATFR